MQRRPVDSRALAAVGYDEATGALELEFRSGRVYGYSGVPSSVYTWLLRARSKAVFVASHLAGRYAERSLPDAGSAGLPLEQSLRDSLERLGASADHAPAPLREPDAHDEA